MKISIPFLLAAVFTSSVASGQVSFSAILEVEARSYSENQEYFFRQMDVTEISERWSYYPFLPDDPPCITHEKNPIGYFSKSDVYIEGLILSYEVNYQVHKHYDVKVDYYTEYEWGSSEPRNTLMVTKHIYNRMLCNFEHRPDTTFEVTVGFEDSYSWERFKNEVSDSASFMGLVGSFAPVANYEIVKKTYHNDDPNSPLNRIGTLITLSSNPYREGGVATIYFGEYLNNYD